MAKNKDKDTDPQAPNPNKDGKSQEGNKGTENNQAPEEKKQDDKKNPPDNKSGKGNKGNKTKLYKVVSGAIVEGHATYHVGMVVELTEERAKQIGKKIEPAK
jgi:hypothetical protein